MRTLPLRARFAAALAVLAASVGGAVALTAAPASAAVPGYEVVDAVSTNSSESFRSVTAFCPAGKVLIGTGYSLAGGNGRVTVDDVRPFNNGVTLAAFETEVGTTANWTIRVEATCASSSIGVVQIVSAPSAFDSASSHTATATCPSGKQVYGTGVEMSGNTGQAILDEIIPRTSGVTVTAFEDDTGFAGSWQIRAYAICGAPLPGLEIVSLQKSSNSSTLLGVDSGCRFSNQRVVGNGAEITGGLGQVTLEAIVTSLSSKFASSFGQEDASGTAANWTLRTYTICATL